MNAKGGLGSPDVRILTAKSTKIISAVLLLTIMAVTLSSATADQPFTPYGYDWWDDTYPIQSGYVVDNVIAADDIVLNEGAKMKPLRKPEDVFVFDNPNPDGVIIELHKDSPLRVGDPYDTILADPESNEWVNRYQITQPMIFIADTGNNRIVVTTLDFELITILSTFTYREDYRVQNFIGASEHDGTLSDAAKKAYWEEAERVFELDRDKQFIKGKTTTLDTPRGIYVTDFQGELRIYIADYNGGHIKDNGRVVAADLTGGVWMEYHCPDSDTFVLEDGKKATFNPSKVLIDNAGTVYAIVPTISRGAVMFSEDGVFSGFFGGNRVTQTAEAVMNYFLRFILPDEVMRNRTKPVPVTFENFTLDNDQFLYTVTMTRSAGVDVVSKINPKGQNIFTGNAYDDITWGAATNPISFGRENFSQMVGISVDEKGDIFLLCQASGQIFQYDKEGHLLFIFGGRGEQQGTFSVPIGIDVYDNTVYVLDRDKSSVTIFKMTEFGELVASAMKMFEIGDYAASKEPWEEVMRRDANYYMANVGMGNAMLSLHEYEVALEYFHSHSAVGYERAFKDYRTAYIRDNFNMMLAVGLGIIILLAGGSFALKVIRKRKNNA